MFAIQGMMLIGLTTTWSRQKKRILAVFSTGAYGYANGK